MGTSTNLLPDASVSLLGQAGLDQGFPFPLTSPEERKMEERGEERGGCCGTPWQPDPVLQISAPKVGVVNVT